MRRLMMAGMMLAVFGLFGCGTTEPHGRVSLLLTDAPLDGAVGVYVTVTGIELVGADIQVVDGGASTTAEGNTLINIQENLNLLDLQDGKTQLLGVADVTGHINQIRLHIGGTVTVCFMDGSTQEAIVPSGAQSGIKIITNDLDPSTASEITLDFDAAKSIHDTGNGKLIMRPTIKAIVKGQVVAESEEVPLDPQ